MSIDRVLQALKRVEKSGDGWKALCPAHEDGNSSLTVSEANDGRVLVHCHAGCGWNQIVAAAGLKPADFFAEKPAPAGGKPRIVATYNYLDEAGILLYQVVRMFPKSFRQRRPGAAEGEWVWSMKGVRRVLYRLPELLAAGWDVPVYLVEGEKDVEAIRAAGGVATCNVGGAGKWDDSYTAVLAKRDLVIIADKDDPGREHAQRVAAIMRGKAARVRVVELPDANGRPVKDAADYLAAGGTLPEIAAIAADTQEWGKAGETHGTPVDKRHATSATNGSAGGRPKIPYADIASEYIASRHMANRTTILRTWRGGWYRYDGTCYREWSQGDVEADAMTFLRTTYRDLANKNALANVMANLRALDLCAIPSTVDAPCWLDGDYTPAYGWMAMKNALVNIDALSDQMAGVGNHAGEDVSRLPTPALFSTFGLPYEMPSEAVDAIMWADYLEGVQPAVADRLLLQKLAGLLLVPRTYNVAFFLYGEGGTGKSVFLHVLTHLVGQANTCCVPLAQFADRFSTWPLTVNLANIVGDMPTENGRGDLTTLEGVFKDVCDGAHLPIERKFQDASKAPVLARCIFATNSLPHFSDRSRAIWDRLRIVGFNQRFRETAKENRNLRFDLVRDELPAIFLWAVQGLARLKVDNPHVFPEHSEGAAEKERLRATCDHERTFLSEFYRLAVSSQSWVCATTIYDEYRKWAAANGYRPRGAGNFQDSVRRVFGISAVRTRTNGERLTIFPGLAKS